MDPNIYTLSIGYAENIVLKLQSFAPDELTFDNPEQTVARGDAVNAFKNGTCIFRGWVYDVKRKPRGKITNVSVIVWGPWASFRRKIYRQQWMALNAGVVGQQWVSKVILNMLPNGDPATLVEQVTDICTQAASLGKFTVGSITLPDTKLPLDQQRSLTCELALMRCLRFFPRIASWFDYSTGAVLHIGMGTAIDWADPDVTPMLEMDSGESGDPIEGVVIEIASSADSDGAQKSAIDYQTAGNVADENKVLQFQVERQAGSSTINFGRIHIECEAIPSGGPSAPAFWIAKHPRCSGLVWGSTLLAVREPLQTAVPYTYICDKPMKDLEAAGIRAKLVTFSCVVDIAIYSDGVLIDTEKDVHLAMDFVTTNKPTGDYSWIESAEAIAPEWIPENLAETLLAQHAHDGEYINVQVPPRGISCRPGDTINSLICMEVVYDFKIDLMSASFGPPTALEPQDLAGLLTGWRNLSRQVSASSRLSGDPDSVINDHNTVAPIRVSDWKPGSKTVIGAASSGKSVVADPSTLPSGSTSATFQQLICHTPAGVKSHHVLCSAPVAPPEDCDLEEKELKFWTAEGLIKAKVAMRSYEVLIPAGSATQRQMLQVVPGSEGNTIGLDYPYWG